MARIHRLKTQAPHFDYVRCGRKTFEVRKDDRGFADGDYLVLDEWSPTSGYTKAKPIVRLVVHLLRGGQFGIADGYVVLGVDELADAAATRTVLDVAPPRDGPCELCRAIEEQRATLARACTCGRRTPHATAEEKNR